MSDIELNVLGQSLKPCSLDPVTGFFRDGHCRTCFEDRGIHTVCVVADQQFLEYSASVGNDLSTPMPEFEFSGVSPGDKWCLCAGRWVEAWRAGFAPRVVLESTHEEALAVVSLDVLKEHAAQS